MSELTEGQPLGMPENWSYPSSLYNYETGTYDDGGMVWLGEEKATKAQKKEMKAHPYCSKNGLDGYSLGGTNDPDYSTWRDENKDEYPYKVTYKVGG